MVQQELQSHTFLHIQDTELAKNLTVRIDGEKSFERGDRVFLNPKKENMHLFNEKGMRIGQWMS